MSEDSISTGVTVQATTESQNGNNKIGPIIVPPPKLPTPMSGISGFSSLDRIKLPQRENRKEFVDHDLQVNNGPFLKSPTERMRDLDSYRLHIVVPSERERVSIPSDIERVMIVNLKHLLALCGGYAQVRFTTEVIGAYLQGNLFIDHNYKFHL